MGAPSARSITSHQQSGQAGLTRDKAEEKGRAESGRHRSSSGRIGDNVILVPSNLKSASCKVENINSRIKIMIILNKDKTLTPDISKEKT